MPIAKKIKISTAKRGHHEKHKKNFGKTKKVIHKEKEIKNNIFSGKKKFAKKKPTAGKSKKIIEEPATEENVMDDIHDMLDSAEEGEGVQDDNDNTEIRSSLQKRKHSVSESDNESEAEVSHFDQPEIEYENDIDEIEHEYQRITKIVNKDMNIDMKELLPIKTKGGLLPRSTEVDKLPKKKKAKADKAALLAANETDVLEDIEESDVELDNSRKGPEKKTVIEEITTVEMLAERDAEIERQKFFIGVTCANILEKPEEKVKNLSQLLDLMTDVSKSGKINMLSIRKLALISLVEVFKDIIPEYRIGIVDTDSQKVKKVTLSRVKYENELLVYFKKYLTSIESFTLVLQRKRYNNNVVTADQRQMAELGAQCMCEVLMSHPYFNYSMNIAQLLVILLNNASASIRTMVHSCFTSIFKTDTRFDLSRHIVRHINNLVKKKKHNVFPELISCLKYLQIKSVNLNAEKEKELKQKKMEAHKARIVNMSKKERKRKKKLAEVEKELFETRAEENKQVKHGKLTDITKLTFTIYFRILKSAPTSKLLSITLEGLSKFAHTINIEFFSDLIEVLNNLLVNTELGYREQLHCIQTVFTILSGQGEVLNIDPARFYTHFYKNLLMVNAGKNHEDMESILMTLDSVLLKRRKNITYHRYLAFVKRLMMMSLQLLHNGSLGCLGIVKTAMQLNSSLDILLDTESVIGSGQYDSNIEEPEFCNANCTNIFELGALHRHYHPTVRKIANNIANGVPASGPGMLPPQLGKLTPIELYTQFDSTKMTFNPPIPPPKNLPAKVRVGPHIFTNEAFEEICLIHLKSECKNTNFNFFNDFKLSKSASQ